MYKLIITALLGSCCLSVFGQTQPNDTTVNRTVTVEQEYNPHITDATKVNVIPAVPPLTSSKKIVEYDWTFTPATELKAQSMQPFTQPIQQEKPIPGEARLGYGSHGNLDTWITYNFLFSPKDRLNLHLGMTGRNSKLELPETEKKWKSHFYRTQAAIDWTHHFQKIDLQLKGDFGLSNFNFSPNFEDHKQKFTSGEFQVDVQSTDDNLPIQFKAETGLLIFQRQHDLFFDKMQEGIIRTKANVSAPINEEQHIGITLQMDNIFYQEGNFKNYTSLQLNPYFFWQNEDWTIRLGAHVDPTFGFGKKLRIAPNVQVQHIVADNYVLYAQATGGKIQNDFHRLEIYSPYSQLGNQIDATYEQMNSAMGFKGSPLSNWWFHLYGGYQNLKNDLIEGRAFYGQNTQNVYAGLETNYEYKDYFFLHADGIFRHWDTNQNKKEALLLKPTLETNVKIGFRPIHPLLIQLGYQHITREKIEEKKLNDVSNLYVDANYNLFKNIDIYARIYNLLNQDYQYHWGCQSAGTNFVGGVSFRF